MIALPKSVEKTNCADFKGIFNEVIMSSCPKGIDINTYIKYIYGCAQMFAKY